MSKEVLEFSVQVDQEFDMSFDLVKGLLGFILKIFGK
ncbi:MAG: phenylalanyl-tRNA synthetase subunit alpha [Pedobacter sp.]|nr:MAG: phenylalanyl-tRNA synthetase subunit alpha [Pedobacter sp.]